MSKPFRQFSSIAIPLLLLLASTAMAEDTVVVEIKTMPGMRYETNRFQVPAGAKVKVELENLDAMSHNFVVTAIGQRLAVVDEAGKLGPEAPAMNFVPKSDKILAHSKVLEPGAKQAVSFTAPKEEGIYPFVCTYPAHGAVMYGAMYVGNQKLPAIEKDPNLPPPLSNSQLGDLVKGPRVQRTFLPDCGPAAIAVDTGGGISYVFDAGACRMRYAWKGGFLDRSDALAGNGNDFAKIVGRVWWRDGRDFPIRIGESSGKPPTVRYLGYQYLKNVAEFHYEVDGVAVRERIETTPALSKPATMPADPHAGHAGHGAMTPAPTAILIRTFAIGPTDKPVAILTDPAGGAAFTSSVGVWENGLLKLTPAEAKSFTLSMTEKPGVEPLAYWSCNDVIGGGTQVFPGRVGRGLFFDGAKSQIATKLDLTPLQAGGTIAGWVQMSTEKRENQMVLAARNQDGRGIGLGFNFGRPEFSLVPLHGKSQAIAPTTQPAKGVKNAPAGPSEEPWHHVAMVFESSGASLYVDGKPAGTFPEARLPNGGLLFLGYDGTADRFRGMLDEVRVYDRVLSQAEITHLIKKDEAAAVGQEVRK